MIVVKRIEISPGQKFGDWTVTSGQTALKGDRLYYPCRCACGRTQMVRSDFLRYGRSRSCGKPPSREAAGADLQRAWQQPSWAQAEVS